MNYAANSTEEISARLLLGGNIFQKRARIYSRSRMLVHALILCVAILEGFDLIEGHYAGILILGLAIASIVTLTLARQSHTISRLFRVNLLLTNSLGLDQTDLDNQSLLCEHKISRDLSLPNISHYYYCSNQPPGPKKLKSSLGETLFFAEHLWRDSASRVTKVFIIPSLVLLGIALSAPYLQSRDVISLDRILVLVVAFLSEIHLVTERIEFSEAVRKCQSLYQRLLQADTANNIELVQILCAYSAISFATPPPIQAIYNRRRNELNEIWAVESTKCL